MEKIKINKPVICEGKYDKIKLSSIIDADIITTDGFGIFREHEKLALIRRLAEKDGIIVFTDSDGAGLVIRNYFNSAIPREKLTHLYTPQIPGKEKRKKAPSKAGFLGVEGMEADRLRSMFLPFAADDTAANEKSPKKSVSKTDFYADGLSGGAGSEKNRQALAAYFELPSNMSANALLAAINMLYTYEDYRAALEVLEKNSETESLNDNDK